MRALTLSTVTIAFVLGGCGAAPSEALDESSDALAKRPRYTQINITAGPPTHDGWFPRGLSEDGEVIGQAFDCNEDFSVCRQDVIKRRRNGQFTLVAANFFANDVNNRGDAGGCTFDPVTFSGQAG